MSTIPRSFLDRVAATPGRRAVSAHVDGAWRDFTWSDYEERARSVGLGLVATGLRRGDIVAVLGATCFEWAICDVGALCVGAVTVGLYSTLQPEGVGSMHYVLTHSDARFLIVEDTAALKAKIAPILGKLPRVEFIALWRCDAEARAIDPRVISLDDLRARGVAFEAKHRGAWREACEAAQPDDLALLVYTSGTTGQPKGAMLSHRNVCAMAESLVKIRPPQDDDSGVSFLPMAHVAERCVGHYNRILQGWGTHYARSIETLVDDIALARPTAFGSVPRIFEKTYAAVRGELAKLEPAARAMAEKILEAGVAAARARRRGVAVDPETQALATTFEQTMAPRLRARFGGRCTRMHSGAAPIAVEILELFDACGMPTYEVYGMTETTGVLTSNSAEALEYGTVGRAIPGIELRIADDGEILARGATVFAGYFKDAEATAECLRDGWLHTGDIGRLDDRGFLTITDRKKNILITAGGKNIAPSNVETEVKRDALISYCHLHADRRPYPTALVCLDPERVRTLFADHGPAPIAEHPAVRTRVQQAIDSANERLAGFEQIRKFTILPREFSIDDGELTPTLKVKRREVDRIYADVIEKMYS